MALKIVLLALLVYCASEAQSQGDDNSLPLTYNETTEIQGDGATCPNDQLRQETQQNIINDVRILLQNSVLPLLDVPTNVPQCPCLGLAGGQTQIVDLDMTDPNQDCPLGWREITSPRRTCGRIVGVGCDSATFPVNGISYSRVCGRITAYQCGHTDGISITGQTIDGFYVDGVSVTHGSPRQHIWTFAAALSDSVANSGCACSTGGVDHPIAGNDYFCESASATSTPPTCDSGVGLITSNPLWDGSSCEPISECCDFNNPPWFCKTLPQPTTDDIEVRLCSNAVLSSEDTPIEQLEIYIS